jgi:hypothetical protein
MNPHNYTQLIFDKGAKKYTMEKRQPLQQKLLGKVVSSLQKTETRPMFITCTSTNSKWIKDLNNRHQTLKLAQERVGNTLELIAIGKDFLNGTPAAQQLRDSIDKWDFIKLKASAQQNTL